MKKTFFILLLIFIFGKSYAGNQQYEVLKDETRQLMSQMVADQPPKNSSFENLQKENEWIEKNEATINKSWPNKDERHLLLKTIHYEATRSGLDPELVLGLIWIESGFKKYALSPVGARGFMQVMPFWIKLIGDPNQNLFHLRTNLRYGCTILRHYLDIEKGNTFRALGRYNGSLGKAEYPNAVLWAKTKFKK